MTEAKLTVQRGFFETTAEVMRDIASTGFWPTTYVSDVSPELPVHFHNHNIIGYVIEGSTYLLDEDEQRIDIKAGDRLNIPKGAWHAEGAVSEKMIYIVTVDEPIGLMQALQPMEPRGPFPAS